MAFDVMWASKEKKLIEDFPNLYRDWDLSMEAKRKMLRGCSFYCGEGWEPLIRELSAKLEAMIFALPEEERKRYRATSVKEKFGLLRIYLEDSSNKEMMQILIDAEKRSGTICEECGQPGHTRRAERNGIRTLCDDCFSRFERQERLTK